jgi:hypothetical protein
MKEKGTLMALRDGQSPVAKLAGEAVFELNNPNLLGGMGAGSSPKPEPEE